MDDLLLTLSVIVLFLVRIGVPMIVLVALGVLIDRWQSHRKTQNNEI